MHANHLGEENGCNSYKFEEYIQEPTPTINANETLAPN